MNKCNLGVVAKAAVAVCFLALAGAALTACSNTPLNVTVATAGYDVSAAWASSYIANTKNSATNIATVKALLAAAQATLVAWQNSTDGGASEADALNQAVAALTAFEAQQQTALHAALDCDPTDPLCLVVHRGVALHAAMDCDPSDPLCLVVHRGVARHAAMDCDPSDPLCLVVHRGVALHAALDCDPTNPLCLVVHRG